MPLGSYAILQKIRGSDTGLATFTAGSLGAYLVTSGWTLSGDDSFQIELFNQSVQKLAERRLEGFRIGIYESGSSNGTLIQDDRNDLVTQPYTISLFKKLAREDEYGENEEKHVMDLKDDIVAWAKDSATVSSLTVDGDGQASIYTFTYITTNTIIRDDVNKFVYLELKFNALREL